MYKKSMGGIESMRIANYSASARSRLVSQARLNARSKTQNAATSKLSDDNVKTILDSLNKKSSVSWKNKTTNPTTKQISEAQLKLNYTAIKNAADALQGHAAKLLSTAQNSLFETAIPDKSKNVTTKDATTNEVAANDSTAKTTTPATETDLLKSKENVVNEITAFIDDYNTLLSKMGSVDNSINNMYRKQLKSYVSENRLALKGLGITQDASGMLRVNQKTLKAANVEKMQEVFGKKNSFADKITAKSNNIELNVDNKLEAYNKSSHSSSYNRYGRNYYDASNESKYNVKG